MRKSMLTIPVALLAILAPAVLRASDITYTVDESIGAAGSVNGFITTTGYTGPLGSGDIVNWNLLLNDGAGNTFDLEGPASGDNSQVLVGGSSLDLTATPTQLLFDFSGTGVFILENSVPGDGGPFLCYATYNCETGIPGEDGVYLATENANVVTSVYPDLIDTPVSASYVIGTASVSPVPEPRSLLLLGSGLLGFAGLGWRRFAWRRAG